MSWIDLAPIILYYIGGNVLLAIVALSICRVIEYFFLPPVTKIIWREVNE